MEKAKKASHSLFQSTFFMFSNAWQTSKTVLFLVLALAFLCASKAAAELFMAPVILQKIENAAPLSRLLGTIAAFGASLLTLTGLEAYLRQNALFGRIAVRRHILAEIAGKATRTSYPNTLDTDFISFESRAYKACENNASPTEAFWSSLTDLLANILSFAAWSFLLSGLSPFLLLFITASSVCGYLVKKRTIRWIWLHRKEEASCLKPMDYIRQVSTGRQYAKDIRIFSLQPWLLRTWETAFGQYQRFLAKREKFCSISDGADFFLMLLQGCFTFYWLIRLILVQKLSASGFLLYFTAANGFSRWVTGIMDSFSRLHSQSLDLSVVREFLHWPEPFLFENGKHLPKDTNRSYEIRLENVSFSYAGCERNTISHMNLTVSPGEKLAVVGLNGAGKTTLIKLICGLLDPAEGCVLLNGEDIRQYNRRDYYALFSAVFQDFSILEASAAQNICQTPAPMDADRILECMSMAGLAEKIQSLSNGLDTKIGRQIYRDGLELSGGQAQRLMLARALYKNAPVVILDEPTSALDSIAEHDIYLKYSQMTDGHTSIFISHRLASTRFCDRILFLEQGRIKEEGTHQQLLARGGSYAALFHIQSQYYQEKGVFHG